MAGNHCNYYSLAPAFDTNRTLEEMTRELVEIALRRVHGNQSQAAVFDLLLHLFDIDGCQFVMHRYAPPVQRYSCHEQNSKRVVIAMVPGHG